MGTADMPYPLKFYPDMASAIAALPEGQDWPSPGVCYYAPEIAEHCTASYREQRAHRAPIVVWCPGPAAFYVDRPASRGGGWEVIGDIQPVPTLTTMPSILHVGCYHGWLKDGVLSDDIDGHKYDEVGRLIE